MKMRFKKVLKNRVLTMETAKQVAVVENSATANLKPEGVVCLRADWLRNAL